MPIPARRLTDATIRSAKAQDNLRKLFDGDGLHVVIKPNGSKLWRLKYRYKGRERLIAFGAWPAVTLHVARRLRDEARALLAQGIDPAEARRTEKQRQAATSDTFESVAREWIERRLSVRSASHRERTVRRLERFAFARIGKRPVASITAADVLACVRPIEAQNKRETAHRVLLAIGQVLRFAVATGRIADDPTRALRGALAPSTPRHMPAPTDDPARVGAILRALHGYSGTPEVAAALKLLPYVFTRPGELRTMQWQDVDLHACEWRFAASKTGAPHVVPLSRQAVAILREIEPLTRHRGAFVFPSLRSPARPLSDMALGAAYRRLGLDTRTDITPHGWRAVARTMLRERLGFEAEVIEQQLAHRVPDALGRAYNRTRFLDERRAMMQRWADFLDKLRDGADVLPLKRVEAAHG